LFGEVVVDRHQAIVEIDEQVIELVAEVRQCLAERILRQHVGDRFARVLTAVENGGAGRSKMVALGGVDVP
jgi:hypothetical protein